MEVELDVKDEPAEWDEAGDADAVADNAVDDDNDGEGRFEGGAWEGDPSGELWKEVDVNVDADAEKDEEVSFGQNSSDMWVSSGAIQPDLSCGRSEASNVVHHINAVEGSSNVNLKDLRFSFLRRLNEHTEIVYIELVARSVYR